MKNKPLLLGLMILLMLLSACSGKDAYEPFVPLSKVTSSPDRDAAVQSALSGDMTLPTTAPAVVETEEPFELPSFDEDSFFAEVDPVSDEPIPTEPVPFVEDPPTPTPMPPTATPEPTAVNQWGTNEMGLTTYTLQEGEDLICLGRRLNVSVTQLLGQNGLTSPSDVGTGSVIVLPRNSTGWSAIDGYGNRMKVRHPAKYEVAAGDNMFSIACYFGDVRPEDIASANGLLLGEPLSPGMQLTIP